MTSSRHKFDPQSEDGNWTHQKVERIRFSVEHHMGKSVAIFRRYDWHEMVKSSGAPTRLAVLPEPFEEISQSAKTVAITASGVDNLTPGIDLVRSDPKDAPYVLNIDRYAVVENLPDHPEYAGIVRTAGESDSQGLRDELMAYVFVVGPNQPSYHWVTELPKHMLEAKAKRDH
jgi:hypothetical protein